MSHAILLVCRANLCRSPVAEVMLARALTATDHEFVVTSAGTSVHDEQYAPDNFAEHALLRGIDLRDHHPVAFSPTLAKDVDLVLPMTRDLLREMVVQTPSLWPKSFTLLEIVRRGTTSEPPEPGDTLGAWIQRVHESRDRAELLGSDPVDDIRDPQADSADGDDEMFDQIERSTRQLARLLWSISG